MKEIIIVLLLLALIYLYYQNKKLKGLPAQKIFVAPDSTKETIFEVDETNEERSPSAFDKDEELIAEKDAAIRSKNEAEQEALALNNRLKLKQQEIGRKEQEIERLKKEASQKEIALNRKITEKNGLITTLQREINQQKEKYSKQGQLLDTEQLECKKLEEKVEQLEQQISELSRSKSPMPGEFPSEDKTELEQKHQGQLKEIYSLFDLRANGMKEIDFNQLMSMLQGVKKQISKKK